MKLSAVLSASMLALAASALATGGALAAKTNLQCEPFEHGKRYDWSQYARHWAILF
jgi:Spy/CpxP family protein refolding chaperone